VFASDRPSRLTLLAQCCVLTLTLAIPAAFVALMTNSACKGDGSFSLDDPGARPSSYCKLTHFPGWPDTTSAKLLVAGLFLTPVLLAVAGGIAALITQERKALYWPVAIAGVWVAAAMIWGISADVGYKGV